MKLLIAEDDVLFRKLLQQILAPDYEVVTAQSGDEAWATLQQADAPQLAILDWVMPGLSGPQVCTKVRQCARLDATYLIILTAKNTLADVVSGLRAGADDYVTKPFAPEEIRARVKVGERILDLKASLAERAEEASDSWAREIRLQQILLSLSCRQAPNQNQEYWPGVDAYLRQGSVARDIHCHGCGLLPDHSKVQPATSPWILSHE
jgi:sigma-B regulation protein RsbU (phosphoserine phosphatase)